MAAKMSQSDLEKGIEIGFAYALDQYAIWKDGEQLIGCMNRNIKDILKRFKEENTASTIAKECNEKL